MSRRFRRCWPGTRRAVTLTGVKIDFSKYQAVLLDLDGTIFHDEHVLPGAPALIHHLAEAGQKYACLSNSTSSPLRLSMRLHGMGIDMAPDHIYSAAAAAADYVLEVFGKRPPGQNGPPPRRARIYNLATEGVQDMLEGLVDWVESEGEPCDGIIVGTSTCVYATEERQRTALGLARRGAAIVGIAADRVYPSPRGIEFGAGALSTMIGYASGVTPTFTGKPQPIFFQTLCQRLGVEPADCLLIGDNLETDIAGAKAMKMQSILTLTGVTRRRDITRVKEELRPDMVVEDLTELMG